MNTTRKTASFIREKDIRFQKMAIEKVKKKRFKRVRTKSRNPAAAAFGTVQP